MAEREPRRNERKRELDLGPNASLTHDDALGDGLRFTLGQGQETTVELFSTPRAVSLRISNALVIFESPLVSSEFVVGAEGEITLVVVPPPGSERVGGAPPVAPRKPEGFPFAENERVQLAGLLGDTPHFRTTRNGVLVARFPLAVHDAEETTWHTVKVFRERAERLRGKFKKGEPVEVIGFAHEEQTKMKTGETKTSQVIVATAVKHR